MMLRVNESLMIIIVKIGSLKKAVKLRLVIFILNDIEFQDVPLWQNLNIHILRTVFLYCTLNNFKRKR